MQIGRARELEALQRRQERIEQLEKDKEALLESYSGMAPEALKSLTPEERHHVYKMLRLKVLAYPDGTLDVTGTFDGPLKLGNSEPTWGSGAKSSARPSRIES